jgi:hypothetical protein
VFQGSESAHVEENIFDEEDAAAILEIVVVVSRP